jgi:hypothetical protein
MSKTDEFSMLALCRFEKNMRFYEYDMIFALLSVNLLHDKFLSECIQIWTLFCFNVKFCTSSRTIQLSLNVVLSVRRRRDEKKSLKRRFEKLVEWVCIIIRLIRRKLTLNRLRLSRITRRSFMSWCVKALFVKYVVYDIMQLTILRWIEIDKCRN